MRHQTDESCDDIEKLSISGSSNDPDDDDHSTIRFETSSRLQGGGDSRSTLPVDTSSLSDEDGEWDVQKREPGEEDDEVF
uniref:Uncharacterized protein n=1 Tax=Caenorhabditis japonica TaxID=281687 RepID=A0A8R1IRB2_CAEJA